MDFVNFKLFERIKYLRKTVLNITQEEFASTLGISRSNVGNIEIGRINITDRVIQDICSKYDVNEHWLRTGEGDMFVQTNKTILDELSERYSLNGTERAVVETFLELSPDGRETVINYIMSVADKIRENAISRDEAIVHRIEDTNKMMAEMTQEAKMKK